MTPQCSRPYLYGRGPTLQTREDCGYSHKLVASRSLSSYVSLILLAITCENSGRSCTGRKSVVSHHKSVGGRSQVYMVVPWSGVMRLELHADKHPRMSVTSRSHNLDNSSIFYSYLGRLLPSV